MNDLKLMSLCDVIFSIRYERKSLYNSLINSSTINLLTKYFGPFDYSYGNIIKYKDQIYKKYMNKHNKRYHYTLVL